MCDLKNNFVALRLIPVLAHLLCAIKESCWRLWDWYSWSTECVCARLFLLTPVINDLIVDGGQCKLLITQSLINIIHLHTVSYLQSGV